VNGKHSHHSMHATMRAYLRRCLRNYGQRWRSYSDTENTVSSTETELYYTCGLFCCLWRYKRWQWWRRNLRITAVTAVHTSFEPCIDRQVW